MIHPINFCCSILTLLCKYIPYMIYLCIIIIEVVVEVSFKSHLFIMVYEDMIVIVIFIFLSTIANPTSQVIGTFKSSSLAKGLYEFQLHSIGLQPRVFYGSGVLKAIIPMSHQPYNLIVMFSLTCLS
jgi:hypothetical protein